jgi:hypothetical protein
MAAQSTITIGISRFIALNLARRIFAAAELPATRFPVKFQNVLFRVALSTSQRVLRVHMAGNGKNVILLGAGQLVLRGDHLNVIRSAGLKRSCASCNSRFARFCPFRQPDLLRRGVEIQERLANVLVHAATQIGNLIVDARRRLASCCASPSRSRSKTVKSIWP